MGLMFLGLALTEAITFYALLMSFVAFFIGVERGSAHAPSLADRRQLRDSSSPLRA